MNLIKTGDFLSSDDVKNHVGAYVRGGGVVVFPTDTLYGLGADPRSKTGLIKLSALKGGRKGKSFPLFIDRAWRAEELFEEFPPLGRELSRRLWPGKLTIVARAAGGFDRIVGSSDGTAGLRLPDHVVARSLAQLCDGCITGTSANRSKGSFPIKIEEVREDFDSTDVLILDGGDLPPSAGSTVVLVEGNTLTIIREGDLAREDILKIAEDCGYGES